ncbi:uncharacterized protein LOC126823353 isoform X2 [Patella vulgata]|nr:uncharacterized protein LOC126823353 isoform X2 [Patella vulgata]
MASTSVCNVSNVSADLPSNMKTDLVTQIVKDETDSKINQLDDKVVQQEVITLSQSPEVKKKVFMDTTSSEELSIGESFVDTKAMRSCRKHFIPNKSDPITTSEGSHETPSSTDFQKSQSDKDIKVEGTEIRKSNSPSAVVDKNESKTPSPSPVVSENTSKTPSPSVADENASKTHSPSAVGEDANRTHSPSVDEENASKTHSPSLVGENASKTHSPSPVVGENASKTHSPSVVEENASKTHSPPAVVNENASKTHSPPAVVDENVVHIVLNVKKDEEEDDDDVDSKLQKSSGSSIASDETFSHNQDTLGFLSNPDSMASFDSISPIPATLKAVTFSYQSQTSEEIPQSSDNHFSSSTSNIDTSDSDASPSSSDGLTEVVLYVQGHSDMMLLMFLEKDSKCEEKNITNLWKSSLSHLAELDFEMKECLNKAKNERQLKAHQGYHFLKYDSFMQTLAGNTLDPITSIGYDYVNTAGKIHDSFTSSQTTNEVLFRTHTACCYGSRTVSKESFFQMKTAQRQPGGCPSPKDAAFKLDQIAVQKLQINQET